MTSKVLDDQDALQLVKFKDAGQESLSFLSLTTNTSLLVLSRPLNHRLLRQIEGAVQ